MCVYVSESRWLRAFWRWCGVPVFGPFKLPRIAACYTKKVVQDPDGSWWCETTYTPPHCLDLDLRDIIMSHRLYGTHASQNMFTPTVTGRRIGKQLGRSAADQIREAFQGVKISKASLIDADYASAEQKLSALLSENTASGEYTNNNQP